MWSCKLVANTHRNWLFNLSIRLYCRPLSPFHLPPPHSLPLHSNQCQLCSRTEVGGYVATTGFLGQAEFGQRWWERRTDACCVCVCVWGGEEVGSYLSLCSGLRQAFTYSIIAPSVMPSPPLSPLRQIQILEHLSTHMTKRANITRHSHR